MAHADTPVVTDAPSSSLPTPTRRVISARWAWAVFIVTCLLAGMRTPGDPDIWFQLLAGQSVLLHGAIPHQEFFLYVGSQAPQVFGGWGFGLIHELGVRLMGPFSLSLVNSIMWAGVVAMALMAARVRNGRQILSPLSWGECAGLALGMIVVYQGFLPRSQMRAEVTLYFAWMLVSLSFEQSRQRERATAYLWMAPLAGWALAWLHTGGFLLLALMGACGIQRMIDLGWRQFLRREGLAYGLSLTALLLLPILNPNGAFQVYAHLISIWEGITHTAPASSLPVRQIVEYLPIWHDISRLYWPAAGFLVIGILIAAARRQQLRWAEWGLILVCGYMSVQHVRSIGLLAMVLAVPLCAAASSWLDVREEDAVTPDASPFTPKLRALTLFVLAAHLWINVNAAAWGWQTQASQYPTRMFHELIKERAPGGAHVFADEQFAPEIVYKLGPSFSVPFAGHTLIRNEEAERHFLLVKRAESGWLAELDKHHVDFMIAKALEGERTNLVAVGLVFSPEWDMVGTMGNQLLFAKLPQGQTLTPRQHWLKGQRFYKLLSIVARIQDQADITQASLELLKEIESHQEHPEQFAWPSPKSMDPAYRAAAAASASASAMQPASAGK